MKKLLLSLIILPLSVTANIHEIDINKISQEPGAKADIVYLRDNEKYYNHWEHEWNHQITRQELTTKLEAIYKRFSTNYTNNTEKMLLLGDVAHFLYNLEQEKYHTLVVSHFEAAIQQSPTDYRGYWFLGNHYSMSAHPVDAIKQYVKAEGLLPVKPSVYFWEEYGYAMYLAQMPSHALYAMSKQQQLTGTPGNFENNVSLSIQSSFVTPDLNSEYDTKETWEATNGKRVTLTSYALGLSITLNNNWGVNPMGLQKGQAAFVIAPPKLKKNSTSNEIEYTMMLMARAVGENDKLEDFLKIFIKANDKKKKIDLTNKYSGMIAYEITDNSIYQNMGGGHMIIAAFERNAPEFPGLALEIPQDAFKENVKDSNLKFYHPEKRITRVSDRIFYLFLVDTCNDIYPQCLAITKDLLNNDIIIE